MNDEKLFLQSLNEEYERQNRKKTNAFCPRNIDKDKDVINQSAEIARTMQTISTIITQTNAETHGLLSIQKYQTKLLQHIGKFLIMVTLVKLDNNSGTSPP